MSDQPLCVCVCVCVLQMLFHRRFGQKEAPTALETAIQLLRPSHEEYWDLRACLETP